jgi:hypothetical protein
VLEIQEDIRKDVIFHYPHTIEEALEILLEKRVDSKKDFQMNKESE